MKPFPASPRRQTHRKRISALRLSSDTTATLPEYIATGGWSRSDQETPSDLPPDYPDSAEEADEDTDDENEEDRRSPYVPQLTGLHSPRSARPKRHRRKPSSPSSSDLYLDSLLERSVHALEMSNALLQSSMSTQNTLSNVFSAGSPPDSTLEASAQGLIRNNKDMHEVWADDLAEISRDVERLFGDNSSEEQIRSRKNSKEGSISSSVPTLTSPLRQHRRRPSLDLRSTSDKPQLRYDRQNRGQLVARPPRALTQYVVADTNGQFDNGIVLPSTLGLRSASSHHAAPSSPIIIDKPPEPSTRAYNMLSSFVARSNSSGRSSRRGSNNSSTVERPSSSSRRQSKQNSPERSTTSRSSSRTRRHKPSSPYSHAGPSGSSSSSSLTITSSSYTASSNSTSHSQSLPHIQRPMTPPQEESSSSSDSYSAKQTISALRKILIEQSPPPPPPPAVVKRPPPSLMRIKTAPPAEAGTSTATASISRLFTKSTHTSSTRPPSPPRISSMKGKGRSTPSHSRGGSVSAPVSLGGSGVTTPSENGFLEVTTTLGVPSTSTSASAPPSIPSSAVPTESKFSISGLPTPSSLASFSDMFGAVSAKLTLGNHSVDGSRPSSPGSGMSTPKRISFVEPLDGTIKARGKGKGKGKSRATLIGSIIGVGSREEEHSTNGSGGGSIAKRRRRRKNSGSLRNKSRRQGSGDSKDDKESWWMGWLMGAAASGGYGGTAGAGSTMRPESRTGWGGHSRSGSGGYSSGLDDWTI
ncbi:hypothetical protein VKT23_001573 [Stygiomarasmius scandens]|uniref:Uncharacterized protein n=1 Tax=Marasmiellus scandens TaxID=2682957 RepID=A0ABR1K255_9AGAR